MADTPPKRVGRPSITPGEETIHVGVRVSVSEFDRACRLAQRHDVSLASIVRRALRRELLREDED